VLHETYLPFTANQLRQHFAPVAGPGERDRHLQYYLASIEEARKYEELIRRGEKPTRAQTRLGRQMEKDVRFWMATALMSLYHADDGSGREKSFAGLLQRAGLRPPPDFPRWEDALAGALDLFFEVNLPSPGLYRAWLRDHLDERTPIPYLKEQAEARGARLEGTTKADAMLLAPASGVAVIFEAKVLSDISAHVTFDLARNQLARSIDVMLEPNLDQRELRRSRGAIWTAITCQGIVSPHRNSPSRGVAPTTTPNQRPRISQPSTRTSIPASSSRYSCLPILDLLTDFLVAPGLNVGIPLVAGE
jgi:hypothetical protein